MRAAAAIPVGPSANHHVSDGGIAASTEPTSSVLGGLFAPADILLHVQSATKREAIFHLAGLLAGSAGARIEDVAAALLRRERLGPTYIGNGIAMPHGRVAGSFFPAAAALRLCRPVDYGTTGDDTADVLVGVTWPEGKTAGFVQALADIRRLLMRAAVAKAIRKAMTPGEMHGVLAAAGNEEGRS
ncbi:MAG: PTS sugar transporter subunit IIA [Mesorhizobium sp.]|nr:PTS sugar transporter subunit IIA [Mesorhizobium sp.]